MKLADRLTPEDAIFHSLMLFLIASLRNNSLVSLHRLAAVLTAQEAGNAGQGIPDEEVLAFAISQER